jgi:hypothetical protein
MEIEEKMNKPFFTVTFSFGDTSKLKIEMEFLFTEIPINASKQKTTEFVEEIVKTIDQKVKELSGDRTNLSIVGKVTDGLKDYVEECNEEARKESELDDDDDSILDAKVIDYEN